MFSFFQKKTKPITEETSISKREVILQNKINTSQDILVAHYTPPFFPVVPIISKEINSICRESWKKIISNSTPDPYGGVPISGVTAFYNDFYEKLEFFDTSGHFDAILSRHSSGRNKIAAKGAILLRIIDFVLKIEDENDKNLLVIYLLGKSHSHKSIRPWQYSIFIQTLLMTITTRLGTDATPKVMEAWVNLFAYILKHMLPSAIKNQVVENEIYINTSSTFHDEKINNEILEQEEIKKLRSKSGTPMGSTRNSYKPVTSRIVPIITNI